MKIELSDVQKEIEDIFEYSKRYFIAVESKHIIEILAALDNVKNKLEERFGFKIENPRRYFTICRISPEKNLTMLMQALKIVDDNGIKLNYILGGDGDKKVLSEIKKISKGFKNVKVKFLGYVSGKAKDKLLKEKGIFVMMSDFEGSSVSTLEAMQYGHPLILSKTGSSNAIFKKAKTNIGRVINRNIQTIADVIIASLSWDYDSISKNCKEEANKYDLKKIAKRYTKIYKEHINGK